VAKRLLILTRRPEGAPFRQRIAPYLDPLRGRGIEPEVEVLATAAWQRRRQFRRARTFDGLLLHRKTLTWWEARALGPLRGRGPLIYDFDDAVMFQARRPARVHPGRARRFARTVNGAGLVLAGSPVLADHAREAGARRVEVVPTGLDTARYPPKEAYATANAPRLVWIGSRSTLKQLARLRPALEAVGRAVPGARLRVVADAPLAVDGLEVENVPWSREAEGRLLAECDVGIAPLPDTPYTRGKCGFKVVQYMAAGLPVVASPVGVQADYVRPEESGLHADGEAEWVEAIRRLAGDAVLRERMGRAGRARAEAAFDFRVLAPRVEALVGEALAVTAKQQS
jgi:glycosyltransferase involved in cell wall biosynthesis